MKKQPLSNNTFLWGHKEVERDREEKMRAIETRWPERKNETERDAFPVLISKEHTVQDVGMFSLRWEAGWHTDDSKATNLFVYCLGVLSRSQFIAVCLHSSTLF